MTIDFGKWTGIHPEWMLFGWIVSTDTDTSVYRDHPAHVRIRYRKFTRAGAERLARRLNRREERSHRWAAESGTPYSWTPTRWVVLGKISEHPGRVR